MGRVVIREYEQQSLASQAKGLLEEAGIPVMLSSDDVGGAFPQLGITGGYRLLIHEEYRTHAEEVLEVLGPYTPPRHKGLFG